MTAVRRSPLVAAAVVVGVIASGITASFAIESMTTDPPPNIVFVARGDNPADALAVGPVAARLGAALVTTPPTSLAPEAEQALIDLAPELVIIAGGTVAISDAVEQAIEATTGLDADKVVRAAGANRYQTMSILIAMGLERNAAYVAVDGVAADSDLLDGLDASAFARSDTACAVDGVVTGIDADGQPVCESAVTGPKGDKGDAGDTGPGGAINVTSMDVTCHDPVAFSSDFTKVSDIGLFTQDEAGSTVIATFHGRLFVESTTASGAVFELRIDDQPATEGRARGRVRTPSESGLQVPQSMAGVFTGMASGLHTVSMWVRAGGTTQSGVDAQLDRGCWSTDHVVVQEFRS